MGEYLQHRNGTKAAIAAGYAEGSAAVTAHRLLRNAKISSAIGKFLDQQVEKHELSADKLLGELCKVAFNSLGECIQADGSVDVSKFTPDQWAAMGEYRVDSTGGTGDGERRLVLRTTVRPWDKLKACDLLGKYLKLWTDKTELTGKDGEPLQPISVEVKFVKPE